MQPGRDSCLVALQIGCGKIQPLQEQNRCLEDAKLMMAVIESVNVFIYNIHLCHRSMYNVRKCLMVLKCILSLHYIK